MMTGVIVLINGAFGVGKTTVARLLVQRLPGSMLYDPEIIGFVIRRLYPPSRRPYDYQDLAAWRSLSVWGARLLRRAARRDLVVPMALWRPDYFTEIARALKRLDPDMYHFCLAASPGTVYSRLLQRGEVRGSWPWQHVEPCVASLSSPMFRRHVNADGRSPEDIADEILAALRVPQGAARQRIVGRA